MKESRKGLWQFCNLYWQLARRCIWQQFVMGAALARQQQYPQAIEYLRRAIELQPDSTWAHYEMGSQPSEDAAITKRRSFILRLPPAGYLILREAHSLLAQAYEHLGRAEDAKRERSTLSTR